MGKTSGLWSVKADFADDEGCSRFIIPMNPSYVSQGRKTACFFIPLFVRAENPCFLKSFGQETATKSSLFFIPGLGADRRLFLHQQKAFQNSFFPSWLPPNKDESLANYAERWVRQLKLKRGCSLVGVSFGGMVIQEMARWVEPKCVVLISSCRTPASIPLYLRMAGTFPTWSHLSKGLCRVLPKSSGRFLGAETPDQRDLLIRMFLETPDEFAEWTVKAIRHWKGCEMKSVKIQHIHGEKDHLIPVGRVQPDKVIPGGGHLINLTHSEEVNGFIRKCLQNP